MAVEHRQDSIEEIAKKNKEKSKGFMALGEQITKLTVEGVKKDQVIKTLGQQQAQSNIEILKLKKELQEVKGAK